MSHLEARCLSFHQAALQPTGTNATKEINTLRKFLHKNQDSRLTDKATTRLMEAIQIYVNMESISKDLKEGLLEDALKLPFTVFSTKQKMKMLKLLEELRGGARTEALVLKRGDFIRMSVIDLEDGTVSLMEEETGNFYEGVSLPEGNLGSAIRKSYESTDESIEVLVERIEGNEILKITKLL
jgi:hypothetical protein